MLNFLRYAQRWLWPAAEQPVVQAEDASSMADLVRLLTEDGEPSGAEAPNDEAAG